MNFLAHAYLSGDDPDLLIGNFMGDFVKGRKYQNYKSTIARGIILHRAIDEFTDQHQVVLKSKQRLRAKYRHYSGVIVDVLYDHFLAKNWNDYHSEDLLTYTQKLYKLLNNNSKILPERMRFILGYMKRDNWLFNYSRLESINRALTGMAKRTKFDSKMELAIFDIEKDYQEFQKEFQKFFPEVIAFVKNQLEN